MKNTRQRRKRIHTTEVGRKPSRRDVWSSAAGDSRRQRRVGAKPKPKFKGKNSLGRRKTRQGVSG